MPKALRERGKKRCPRKSSVGARGQDANSHKHLTIFKGYRVPWTKQTASVGRIDDARKSYVHVCGGGKRNGSLHGALEHQFHLCSPTGSNETTIHNVSMPDTK